MKRHLILNAVIAVSLLIQLIAPSFMRPIHAQPAPQSGEITTTPLILSRAQSAYSDVAANGTLTVTLSVSNEQLPMLTPQIDATATVTESAELLATFNYLNDPNTIRNIVITDEIINGATLISSDPPASQDGDMFIFHVGDVAPMQRADVVLVLSVPTGLSDFTPFDVGATAFGAWAAQTATATAPLITLAPAAFADNLVDTVDVDLDDEYMLRESAEITANPIALFERVRDMDNEVYAGSLRGTRGTLWSEAGNSVDKSSLLIALLRNHAIPARYVRGTLAQAQAQTIILSMFPESISERRGVIPADVEVSDPVNDPLLLADAQDHTWVEAYIDGSWVALDPSFATAVVGDSFAVSAETLNELPDDLRHAVDLTVRVEQYTETNQLNAALLDETIPLTATFYAAETVGLHPTLRFAVETTQRGGLAFSSVEHIYTPYFELTGRDVFVVGEAVQDLLTNFPLGSRFTTGVWLDVTLRAPTGERETHTRMVKDLIGADARQSVGTITLPEQDGAPLLSPTDLIQLQLQPHSQTPALVQVRKIADLLAAGQQTGRALLNAPTTDLGDGLEDQIDTIINSQRQLLDLLGVLFEVGISAPDISYAESNLLVRTYPRLPNLRLLTQTVRETELTASFELLRHRAYTVAYPGQATQMVVAANLLRSANDKALEVALLDTLLGDVDSGYKAFSAAVENGDEIIYVSAETLSVLETLPLSAEIKALISEQVTEGNTVFVPLADEIGWMVIDKQGYTEFHNEAGLNAGSFVERAKLLIAQLQGLKAVGLVSGHQATLIGFMGIVLGDLVGLSFGVAVVGVDDTFTKANLETIALHAVTQSAGVTAKACVANALAVGECLLGVGVAVADLVAIITAAIAAADPSLPNVWLDVDHVGNPATVNMAVGSLAVVENQSPLTSLDETVSHLSVFDASVSQWQDGAIHRAQAQTLSAENVTLSDNNGVVATGALALTQPAIIGTQGGDYTSRNASHAHFGTIAGGTGETLTLSAPHQLTLERASVTVGGDTYDGDFTAAVSGVTTTTVDFIAPLAADTVTYQNGHLLLGASNRYPNGIAIVDLTGSTTYLPASGEVEMAGSADWFTVALSAEQSIIERDETTQFAVQIDTSFGDDFNLVANAPARWDVAINGANVSATPPASVTAGDYQITLLAQSHTYPDLTLAAMHTISVNSRAAVTLSLAPDPLFTVPMGNVIDETAVPSILGHADDGTTEVENSAFVLTVHNDSTETNSFDIQVSGLPAGWLKMSSEQSLTLGAGESAEIGLYVQPDTLPVGGTSYTINATVSGDALSASDSIIWTMPASGFPLLQFGVEQSFGVPDNSVALDLKTTNVGNDSAAFTIASTAQIVPHYSNRYTEETLSVTSATFDTGQLATGDHIVTQLAVDTTGTAVGDVVVIDSQTTQGVYEPNDLSVLQIVSAEALCVYNASLSTDAPLSTALLNLGATIDSFVSDPNQRTAVVNAIYAVRGLVQQFATAGLNDDLDTVAQAIADGNDDAVSLSSLCEVIEDVETESTQATFHARLSPNIAMAKVGEPVELTLTIENEDETPIAFAINFAGTSENATIPAGQTQTFSRTIVAVAGEQVVTAVVSADRVLTRTATVNGVEQLVAVVGVSADPFLIEPDSPTTIAAQISNLYFGDSATAASVTVFNDGGGEIASVDVPLTLTPNSITEYTLTDLDTTGWATGVYTVVVDVNGSVGETVVLVGWGVSAEITTPQTVAPGNPTITTLITTTTNLTADQLSRTTHHAPNTEWSDNTPAGNVGILAAAAIGDLDGDGNPEIVVPGYVGQIADTDGRLYAYAGTGGAPLWTVDMERAATPAIADIDGDGDAEVLVIARDAFYVIDHNGNVIHRDPTIKSRYAAPSISRQRYHWGGVTVANLDADIDPEIVVSATDGSVVLDNDFSVLKRYGDDFGLQAQQTIPVVAELTGDGAPDILAAYNETLYLFDYANDSLAWTHTFTDGTTAINTFGSPAVADLDGDDALDIIAVWDGHVQRISAAGTLVWSRATGGIRPSSPIIADVDGDDAPEIIFTVYDNSHDELFVFEADGSILWQKTVLDSSASSSAVGAYDLDGDGSAEILYNGSDQGFAIFDGRDGSEIYSDSAISSGTLDEIIPVADVDGDGLAEIIVGDENGIHVIGNDADWIGARATFNQYNYHANNINDDLSVPPVLNTTWDSFRTQRSDGYAKPSIVVTLTHVFGDGSAENRTYSQSTTHKTNSFTQTVAALQPGEVRAVSQRTTVAYSYDNNSGVMTLPTQNVIGGRLGTLAPFAQTVAPNGTAAYAVTLQHGANAITVTGLPESWVAIDGTTIHITPSADAGGDYNFAVELGNDDGVTDVLQARLTVVAIADLTITPEYATTDVGETVPYTISVTNLHTETVSFNLTVAGDVDASFVGGSRLTVGAGATGTKVVKIGGSVGLGSFAVSAETINSLNGKSQAFAAIDVQPTHLIEATVAADTVSVGAGGTAIFDLSVTNLGTLPDSYELSANIFDIGVGRFTANGLRITNVEIQPSLFNTAQIDLLFDVPANITAGTYSGFVRVRSEQTEATIPLTVEVLGAGVAVDVVDSRGTTLDVTIENTGDSADSFTLSLAGALAPFATLSAASVSLDSGASTTLQLTVNADEIALADSYTIGVVAQSQNDARVMGADSAEIPFNPLEAVAIAWLPSEQTSWPNSPVTFLLTVTNTGRTAGFFNASTTTRANLSGTFNRPVVYLPPHTSATLIFRTTAPAENGLYTLDATVAGTTVSDSAQATLIVGNVLAVGLSGGQAGTSGYLVWLSLSLLLVTAGLWLVWRRD